MNMTIEPSKKNLRQLRQEAGISQTDMARMLKVSRNTVINYESGRTEPPLGVLMQMLTIIQEKQEDDRIRIDSITDDDAPPEPTAEEHKSKKEELRLAIAFNKLNTIGRAEAVNRVEEMTHIPKYTEGGEDHGSET